MLRFATSTLCALLLSTGCAKRDLDWQIVFEPTSVEDRVVRVDVRISRGPCPGTESLWDETVYPGAGATEPPTLPAGTYCLAGQAADDTCAWIARGEQAVVLPTDGTVTVALRTIAAESYCPAEMCGADGACGESRPGEAMTCLTGGCVQTCTSDCTASCVGGGCTQTCTGGAATECTFSCAGSGCTVLCEDNADCVAECQGGRCDYACRGAITDCVFGCIGGGCSFACEDPDDCTTSCSSDCTGP